MRASLAAGIIAVLAPSSGRADPYALVVDAGGGVAIVSSEVWGTFVGALGLRVNEQLSLLADASLSVTTEDIHNVPYLGAAVSWNPRARLALRAGIGSVHIVSERGEGSDVNYWTPAAAFTFAVHIDRAGLLDAFVRFQLIDWGGRGVTSMVLAGLTVHFEPSL